MTNPASSEATQILWMIICFKYFTWQLTSICNKVGVLKTENNMSHKYFAIKGLHFDN